MILMNVITQLGLKRESSSDRYHGEKFPDRLFINFPVATLHILRVRSRLVLTRICPSPLKAISVNTSVCRLKAWTTRPR
jgi:hypothetical protein